MTVTPQHKLLATCPCLNVKLHLAAEPEQGTPLAGKELKLGLAGVSVEQKILCSLSISKDLATTRCSNCDSDVYTFKPSSSSVNLESTSLAYLAGSALYSPSNGIVVPTEAVVTGQDIDALVNDPNYSKAFRLILASNSVSSSKGASDPSSSSSTTTPTTVQKQPEFPYRPHLEKVRAILEKELETNLNAQQLRTEARIEAYKSQQLLALQEAIENTKREKERLWIRIQERATTPPPPASTFGLGESGAQGNISDGPLDVNGSQNLLDVPATLPVRFTTASPHSPFMDRKKSSNTDVAMSLQFREFDQRLASNSLRRQSLIPATIPAPTESTNDTADATRSNTVANAATATFDDQPSSSATNSGTSSPTGKSKKKVTISDAIKKVSIVEPENADDVEFNEHDVDEEEEEEEEEEDDGGVVFDLDEELGFEDDGQQAKGDDDSEDSDQDLDAEDDGEGDPQSESNGIAFSSSGRSLPKSGGMVVGSLRANYLRRQRGLQQHRRSLIDDDLDFDEDAEDDDYNPAALSTSDAISLGTSLPIQIQTRPTNLPPPPPPTARASALASSLALPPGSSPAAAMLQRRLSRAYGTDIPTEISMNTAAARSTLAGSLIEGSSSFIPPASGAAAGAVIIDPLMLLEEEHDNDDREDRLRKFRQPFSAINSRRDSAVNASAIAAQQTEFEPPHVYSARTYVGSTPWEMPTRVTVKSGGFQREGTQLDKQIAAEMAKELEMERQEKEKATNGAASLINTSSAAPLDPEAFPPNHPFSTVGSNNNEQRID
ncbi:hypothetical protein BGZ80_001481, partial [Entomortierella chlamydospora]